MVRLPAGLRAVAAGTLVLLMTGPGAAQVSGPMSAMYADDQVRGKTIALGFLTASVPAAGNATAPAQVYITQGDLQRAFDDSRFRPDAAVVPTNTELRFTAAAPATQRVLIDRLQKAPAAMAALQAQGAARRAQATAAGRANGTVLDIATDSFVATFAGDATESEPFPRTVCLLATDFADGGAIDRRELFAQDRMRKGIASCLTAVDAAGAHSLVIPLVGAASSGTQTRDPQYEGQRVLMECRLINAIAGITLGIHDFAATRRNLQEIGIVQWDQETLGMFGVSRDAAMSRAAQSAYRTYTNQVKIAVRNGLAGQKTTAGDVSGNCNAILGAR